MAELNFILSEMTFLRYYIPLIVEGNIRNVKSNVYIVRPHGKYSCPARSQPALHSLSKQYGFGLFDISSILDCTGPIFFIEGVGLDMVKHKENKKISLSSMTDFVRLYEKYVDALDHIILPSEYMANYYERSSEKNLYLGSPKYDFKRQTRDQLLGKYNLPDEKFALVVYPRARDLHKAKLERTYDFIRRLGYKILVKTRGKDPIFNPEHKGDHTYMDYSWYPHDTMELMCLSDFVINYDSTAIKECVMLHKPIINYNIKPKVRHGIEMGTRLSFQEFMNNKKP